jgi:hypothetical protein
MTSLAPETNGHELPAASPTPALWTDLCWAGGVSASILMVYSLAIMVQLAVLGGQPVTAAEAFRLPAAS